MKAAAKNTGLTVAIVALISALLAVPVMAQDVIQIGAIYSFTGPLGESAKHQKSGIEMSIREVNDAGGVEVGGKKMKLEAIFGDDQTKSEIATQLFEDMVKNKKVAAVIAGSVAHVPMALNTAAKKDKVSSHRGLRISGRLSRAKGEGPQLSRNTGSRFRHRPRWSFLSG